jgi:hypothetical protein
MMQIGIEIFISAIPTPSPFEALMCAPDMEILPA